MSGPEREVYYHDPQVIRLDRIRVSPIDRLRRAGYIGFRDGLGLEGFFFADGSGAKRNNLKAAASSDNPVKNVSKEWEENLIYAVETLCKLGDRKSAINRIVKLTRRYPTAAVGHILGIARIAVRTGRH